MSEKQKSGVQDGPVPKPDRRLRNLSRESPSDRRKHLRYLCQFPLTVVFEVKGQKMERVAHARDISDGGVLLEGAVIPPHVEQVSVKFKVPDGAMPEELIHGEIRMEGLVRFRNDKGGRYGIEFKKTMAETLAKTTWMKLRWLAAIGFIGVVSVVVMLKYENLYFFWFDVPLFLYSLLVGSYLITRFIFAAFYRKHPPLEKLPTVSVIAPVFNERTHVGRMIRQVMESHYPAEKLQFIVVNDGSTDGTSGAIAEALKVYEGVELIEFEKSRGKRHALGAGAELATGEILVFIDSDSFLDPDALKNLVKPFADPEIAAVTGHCDVENVWTNALTRMQAVRYYIAFRVIKAAESVFDSVTCLSGPLAAYRRTAFDDVKEEWLTQTFLGQPATYGDDRSLTNSLLMRGCKVVYAEDARVTTVVPDDHHTFLRQQLRWKRSWFRESMRACGFFWKRPPLMSISFYLGFILPLLGPAVVLRSLVYVPLTQSGSPFVYIFGVILMSGLISTTYLFIRRSRLWYYGLLFCFYYMFVLIWQLPWAVVTSYKTQWGTRSDI